MRFEKVLPFYGYPRDDIWLVRGAAINTITGRGGGAADNYNPGAQRARPKRHVANRGKRTSEHQHRS